MLRVIAIGLCALLVGCTHHQLRYSTTKQADTLNDIYRRQVLDNLAMFVADPYAVPHFAIPNGGTASISDTGSFSATPLNSFRTAVGLGGDRNVQESWALDPVRDPDKLRLMRCAYQRAVGVCDPCTDCCDLEKKFLDKEGTVKIKVCQMQDDGSCTFDATVLDPLTRLPFVDECGNWLTNPRTGAPYVPNSCGCVEIPAYDCNGPCTIKCGWFRHGGIGSIPKTCKDYAGHYCGTYVWVEPEYRHELAKLVLTIMDYAEKDPPAAILKDVTLYVNGENKAVTQEEAVGIVTATIPVGVPSQSILYEELDNCETPSAVEAAPSGVRSVRENIGKVAPPPKARPSNRGAAMGAGTLYERMFLDSLAPPARRR